MQIWVSSQEHDLGSDPGVAVGRTATLGDCRGLPWQPHLLGGAMSLSSTDWTALGSIFTAVAAFIALGVGIVPYRQQNRLARATALRGLVRTVFHDSQEIYDLTVYASSVIADAQVRAFRRQLGETATVADFLRYFFTDRAALAATSFVGACLDSPAYSRLNVLWNDIDGTSAELRGPLRILYHAAVLITSYSQTICFPTTSITIAQQEMASDSALEAKCKGIHNMDTLVLVLSQELNRKIHIQPYDGVANRLEHGRSFVESLASTIRSVSDRSLRDLASESASDWSELMAYEGMPGTSWTREETPTDNSEEGNLDNIDQLMKQVKPRIPVKAAGNLEEQFIKWQEAYAKDS
jgi:hypothetical protein